ncbi:hypothetical protein [Aeromicrobium sp.]|uniref:hypothetical protein n=1 Tax=Aeromicrobium sp. TaxID=1871063 RepID=UPI0030C115C7
MTYRRVTGLAAALALAARFVITNSSWADSIASTALGASAAVAAVLAFRANQISAAELLFTWVSVVLYSAGGTYLDHWSGEGDIGGVVPGVLGLAGMLVVALALNLPTSRRVHQ